MGKSLLFTFRHAPYGSSIARDGLEALMAAAVYDQRIAVVFLGDGVWQLTKEQQVVAGLKSHARMLSALPVYGVDQIFVHEPSLQIRGLADQELLLNPAKLSHAQTRDLFGSYNHSLSF